MKLGKAKARRLRLLRGASKMHIAELLRISLQQVPVCIFQKKKRIGALCWRTLRSQIRYNPEIAKASKDGGVDGTAHIGLWAVNANWNSGNGYWNVEANSVENPNEWNAGNQILSRYYFLSSAFKAEVLFTNPFFHPPIILPKSSMSVARKV